MISDGVITIQDSPLLIAVAKGHVCVLDECDKVFFFFFLLSGLGSLLTNHSKGIPPSCGVFERSCRRFHALARWENFGQRGESWSH
jgi:hypothetical protein